MRLWRSDVPRLDAGGPGGPRARIRQHDDTGRALAGTGDIAKRRPTDRSRGGRVKRDQIRSAQNELRFAARIRRGGRHPNRRVRSTGVGILLLPQIVREFLSLRV